MKNVFLMLLSLLFFANCNSDDDAKNNTEEILENKLVFMGEEILLANYSYYYDYEEDILRVDVGDADENSYNKIEFHFSKIEVSELGGTYTFNNDVNDPAYDPQSNFYKAIVTYKPNGMEEQEYMVNGGEIIVSLNGENVEIDFELQTNAGPATGHFEGRLVENN